MARIFVGGLPISNTIQNTDVLSVVGKYAKTVELIKDAEGYCKGFAYINVPSGQVHDCVASLNGAPFQKGFLRVEAAKEPYMNRLRQEWAEAAVEKSIPISNGASLSYERPTSPPVLPQSKATKLSFGTPTTGAKKTPVTPATPATPTTPSEPFVLDTSGVAGGKTNGVSNKKLKQKQRREARESRKKPRTKNESKAPEPQPAEAAESESGPESDGEPGPAPVPEPKQKPARMPTPMPKKKPARTPTPRQAKKTGLFLGDDDTPAPPEPPTTPAEPPTTPAKPPASTPKQTPKNNKRKAGEGETPNQGKRGKQAPPTPAPVSPPAPPAPTSPTTSSSSAPSVDWTVDQVAAWTTQQVGPEIAAKLQAKGVKGRKLFNWRDTFQNDAGGLRKQMTEFLGLPENMEADADDLAFSIVKLP